MSVKYLIVAIAIAAYLTAFLFIIYFGVSNIRNSYSAYRRRMALIRVLLGKEIEIDGFHGVIVNVSDKLNITARFNEEGKRFIGLFCIDDLPESLRVEAMEAINATT